MTDYEEQYQKSRDVCGPPFQELVAFFERYDKPRAYACENCGKRHYRLDS